VSKAHRYSGSMGSKQVGRRCSAGLKIGSDDLSVDRQSERIGERSGPHLCETADLAHGNYTKKIFLRESISWNLHRGIRLLRSFD
jgi:hypothetical protein